jgi:hypothetical protein
MLIREFVFILCAILSLLKKDYLYRDADVTRIVNSNS